MGCSSDAVRELQRRSVRRSLDFFVGNFGMRPRGVEFAKEVKINTKIADEYEFIDGEVSGSVAKYHKTRRTGMLENEGLALGNDASSSNVRGSDTAVSKDATTTLSVHQKTLHSRRQAALSVTGSINSGASSDVLQNLVIRQTQSRAKAAWHPKWKLMRVISGHQGWVRCLAIDPGNEYFVSGGADRLIKIWDLATGTLKLSLTGHVNTVRGLEVSPRHPYMFSCGEDHSVKCWDLEYNKVIRDYHGHLSGVYCMTLHPAIDVLATGGRDAVVRVWDIRTKQEIHVLSGHTGTIMSLVSQSTDPQIISGSMDKMVRCWDLVAGKTRNTLTNHKKSIRGLGLHPRENSFCSAGADNVKVWRCPEGKFERNFDPAKTIINCLAIKEETDSSVLVAGADQGYLVFWDWKTGHKFQTIESKPQPGSMASENGIFDVMFDKSETRLITAECDKTIKIWKEEDSDE